MAAAFVGSWLLVRHDAAAQRAEPLTAMDYIEIQQLLNRLNFALDYCTNGGRDFADLFVDGGQFLIDEGDGNPRSMTTREQLVALAGGASSASIMTSTSRPRLAGVSSRGGTRPLRRSARVSSPLCGLKRESCNRFGNGAAA
jgi:hypothetical protein